MLNQSHGGADELNHIAIHNTSNASGMTHRLMNPTSNAVSPGGNESQKKLKTQGSGMVSLPVKQFPTEAIARDLAESPEHQN